MNHDDGFNSVSGDGIMMHGRTASYRSGLTGRHMVVTGEDLSMTGEVIASPDNVLKYALLCPHRFMYQTRQTSSRRGLNG